MPSQAYAQVHMRTCLERTDDAVGGAVTRDSAGLALVVEEVSERQVCHRQGVSPSRVVSEDQAILPAATLRRLVDDVPDACLDGSERAREQRARGSRFRSLASVVLLVLTGLLLFVGLLSAWANTTVYDSAGRVIRRAPRPFHR